MEGWKLSKVFSEIMECVLSKLRMAFWLKYILWSECYKTYKVDHQFEGYGQRKVRHTIKHRCG